MDPLQGATLYAYDAMSHLTSLTDANGHTTAFHYDGYGRVDTRHLPERGLPEHGRDLHLRRRGAPSDQDRPEGRRHDLRLLRRRPPLEEDLLGRHASGDDPPEVFTYDPAGHLLTAANGTDTLTWAYDLAGQLLSEQSTKNASTVAYTYDLGGNRLSLSLDGTLFVSYAYDDASRLTTITKGASVFGLGYDNANRRTSMTYPNGVSTSYTYDTLNRLTNLAAVLNGATPVTNFTYVYDNAGNRTRKQQLDYTEDYGYDRLYRLTSVSRTGSTPPSQWAYGYDPVGNRTTEQVDNNLLTAVYDQRNELTRPGDRGLAGPPRERDPERARNRHREQRARRGWVPPTPSTRT